MSHQFSSQSLGDTLPVQRDDAALSRNFRRFERVYRDQLNQRWAEIPPDSWRSMAPTANADETRSVSGLRPSEISYKGE